jgi:hypothetical protein
MQPVREVVDMIRSGPSTESTARSMWRQMSVEHFSLLGLKEAGLCGARIKKACGVDQLDQGHRG